jgi:hypothetical protein
VRLPLAPLPLPDMIGLFRRREIGLGEYGVRVEGIVGMAVNDCIRSDQDPPLNGREGHTPSPAPIGNADPDTTSLIMAALRTTDVLVWGKPRRPIWKYYRVPQASATPRLRRLTEQLAEEAGAFPHLPCRRGLLDRELLPVHRAAHLLTIKLWQFC